MSMGLERPPSAEAGKDPLPSRVLGHVFLGSKAHARSRDALTRLRISHILNCTPPKSMDPVAGVPNYYERDDDALTYLRIPVFDNAGENITPFIRDAVDFIDRAQFYGNVLVHCNKGVSRSPSFVIAYLMEKNDFTLEEALDYVRSCRPVVNPNASFIEQLRKYETTLSNGRAMSAITNQNDTDVVVAGPVLAVGPPSGPSVSLRDQAEPEAEAETNSSMDHTTSIQTPAPKEKISNGTQRIIVIDVPKHPDILYPIRNTPLAPLRAASDPPVVAFEAGDGSRPRKRCRWEEDLHEEQDDDE